MGSLPVQSLGQPQLSKGSTQDPLTTEPLLTALLDVSWPPPDGRREGRAALGNKAPSMDKARSELTLASSPPRAHE